MSTLQVTVDGIGAWAVGHEGWTAMRTCMRMSVRTVMRTPTIDSPTSKPRRPAPLLLPAAERRRVPDGVAVALEVAREALAMAGATRPLDTSSLASVFASAHGDLAIVDYLCATLAEDPTLLSPTRFHHSVHNAAAGYWSIATPSVGPSTSLAAGDESFALGLLEAMTQVVAEDRPVLLVVFDTPAVGLLARVAPNSALFGAALLLSPLRADDGDRLALCIEPRASHAPSTRDPRFHALAASSPAARALAILEAFARGDDTTVDYPMDATSTIAIRLRPAQARRTATSATAIE
jgi:hypothetical protein